MARGNQTTINGLVLPTTPFEEQLLTKDEPAFRIPLMRSLRMHPWLALGVGLLVLGGLLGFALSRKPTYRAESRVYVEPIPTKVLGSESGVGNFDLARYESFLQEQMETVQRPDILLEAVKSMPAGVWQQPGETAEGAAARLGAALKTERVSTSYQLSISVGAATPSSAAAAANAVTRAYLVAGQKDAKALSAAKLELLTEERQRLSDEMDARRAEQRSLGTSLGVANPSGVGGDSYDAELQTMRGQLATARQAHDMAAAQLAALGGPGGAHSAGTVAVAEEAVATDPAISSLRIAINQRRTALMTQMNGMKPANPVYQDNQAELAKLDQQLAGITTGMQAQVEQRMEAKLRQDLQRTGDLKSRLDAEVNRDTSLATSAGPKLQRTAELTADLTRLQVRYAAVDDSVRSLELETSSPGMAHLAVAASVPAAPEPNKSRLALLLALPLALLLGPGAAVLAKKMDSRVYTPADVEESVGFAPIGVLPAPSEVSESVTEEYLLRLAAGLEAACRGGSAQSFVLTAASAGTSISTEVEAVRRKLVELGVRATLLAAEDVMQSTARASNKSVQRARLVGPTADDNLLLIDACPLLHSALAEYAVRSSDGVILVVESGVTTRHELAQAMHLLRRLQASGIGMLLQGMTLRNSDPEFRRSIAVLEERGRPQRTAPLSVVPVKGHTEQSRTTIVPPFEESPLMETKPAPAKVEVTVAKMSVEAVDQKMSLSDKVEAVLPPASEPLQTEAIKPLQQETRVSQFVAEAGRTSLTENVSILSNTEGVEKKPEEVFVSLASMESQNEGAVRQFRSRLTSIRGDEAGPTEAESVQVELMPALKPVLVYENFEKSEKSQNEDEPERHDARSPLTIASAFSAPQNLSKEHAQPAEEVTERVPENESIRAEERAVPMLLARRTAKSWSARDEDVLPFTLLGTSGASAGRGERGAEHDRSLSAARRRAARRWATLNRSNPSDEAAAKMSSIAPGMRSGQRG